MATVKFTDYFRLVRAVDQAKHELHLAHEKGYKQIAGLEIKLDHLLALKELYDFGRSGAIFIDLKDAYVIKRFSKRSL